MKNKLSKIATIFLILPFMAVQVDNPAPAFFSTAFGTDFKKQILPEIIKLLIGFAGLIALAYIILGGFQMASARGNDEVYKKGQKTLTNAIIGLVIIILSYVIVAVAVNALFGNVKAPNA